MERITKHGLANTKDRLYRIWRAINSRCNSVNGESYSYYGGRGISVCDEWSKDYLSFRNWSLNNGYSDELTIDRIDNDGNYEPTNCRWATRLQQDNNRRDNIHVVVEGEKVTIADLSRKTGIPVATLYSRYNRHSSGIISFEEIIRSKRRVII